jgi:hypothetical protein
MTLDSAGNPRVDFAWGNKPLQPNDDRTFPGVSGYFTDTFTYNASPNVWAFTGEITGLSIGDSFVISQHLNPDFNITYEVIDIDGSYIVTNQYFETSGPYGDWMPCRWDKVVENQQVVETIGGGEGDYGWSSTQTKTSLQLDPTLDNHLLATGLGVMPAGYAGYPGFLPNDSDNIRNTVVPDLFDATLAQAIALLEQSNLVLGTTQEDTSGATDGNDGEVKSQSIASGTVVNEGTAVNLVLYKVTLYTISFNRNGGVGVQDSLTVRETSPSFVLPTPAYTRDNHEFVGWSTDFDDLIENALPAGSTVNNVAEDRTYYAIWLSLLATVSGGDLLGSDGTYRYRAFTSSGTFTTTNALNADLLVIAGGGGNGNGGAGGVRYLTSEILSEGSYDVTVGAGGSGGSNGTNSSVYKSGTGIGWSATGGGAGGGSSGGSGGGGSQGPWWGSGGPGGSGTSGQGHDGGPGGNNGSGAGGGASKLTGRWWGPEWFEGPNPRGVGGNGANSGSDAPWVGLGGEGTDEFNSWGSLLGLGENVDGVRYFGGGGGTSRRNGYGVGVNTGGVESSGVVIIRYLISEATN